MVHYIAIDGGTTNTRVNLTDGDRVIDSVKISAGARSGLSDAAGLKNFVRDAIAQILKRNALTAADIEAVLACGMLGSESGLYRVDHILAPAGVRELHDGMVAADLPEVFEKPLLFVPGVKLSGEDAAQVDIMRGEETELFGLVEKPAQDTVYILPGSHSKHIETDEEGRISHFVTMLSGEMTEAVSQHTILKDAVHLDGTELVKEGVLYGYRMAEYAGVNTAFFKARILKNQLAKSPDFIYSYFMGVVLHDEIGHVIRSGKDKAVIGGRSQIKEAMCMILREVTDKEIIALDESLSGSATTVGMVRIYEYRGE